MSPHAPINFHAEFAPAKINLALYVLGKRADGYHDIATLIQPIDLCDVLEFERVDDIASEGTIFVTCDDASLPTDERNLVTRAATLVAAWARAEGTPLPATEIHLRKRIPREAGLGGGSADAAATIRGLAKLHGLRIPVAARRAMALALGSDVPACLEVGAYLALGRGEQLTRLALPTDYYLVLAKPPEGVSTASAYARVVVEEGAGPVALEALQAIDGRRYVQQLRGLRNDLERAILPERPDIAETLERLRSSGAAVARMTGSGSACYGVFTSRDKAERALAGWSGPEARWLCRPRA